MPRNIVWHGQNPRRITHGHERRHRRRCGRIGSDNELQFLSWQSSDNAARGIFGSSQFWAGRVHVHIVAIEANLRERAFEAI